jgi:uncharacterized protein YjbI with pentapeptide repeats
MAFVSLVGSTMNKANFTAANLNQANLQMANFQYANLSGANISGANVFVLDLGNATCPSGASANASGFTCSAPTVFG